VPSPRLHPYPYAPSPYSKILDTPLTTNKSLLQCVSMLSLVDHIISHCHIGHRPAAAGAHYCSSRRWSNSADTGTDNGPPKSRRPTTYHR